MSMLKAVTILLCAGFLAVSSALAQSATPEFSLYDDQPEICPRLASDTAPTDSAAPAPHPDLLQRLLRYIGLEDRHRLTGLASYYSGFFDGRKTANGEIFRNQRYSAAHLTLPLGSWVEVTSRATGRKLRLRVNDRGPYAKKFALDLSQAAARYLGVDTSRDRHVEIRIIALPGEEPVPEDVDWTVVSAGSGPDDKKTSVAVR